MTVGKSYTILQVNMYTPPEYIKGITMPHSPKEKKAVLTRVRKIKGQMNALEVALEAHADCRAVLQQIAAIRGAINGLMAGVLESHLREELTNIHPDPAQQQDSIEDAVALIRTYLR